ncbi:MAG: hypothetical protein M0Z28_08300 [Rhodospirillales bacterium]|nr:hypothetical protein [Rhodospirillales bacterium]
MNRTETLGCPAQPGVIFSAASAAKTARQSAYKRKTAVINGLSAPHGVKQWTAADADILLERVRAGRRVKDVLRDPDMPGATWLHDFMREKPDYRQRLLDAVDTLPFSVQARNHMGMGPRFTAAVTDLRLRGLSDKSIAARLGVTAMTVHKHRKKHSIA